MLQEIHDRGITEHFSSRIALNLIYFKVKYSLVENFKTRIFL